MATAEAVREFRSAQNGIVVLAQAELFTFWASLDTENAVATSLVVQEFTTDLIAQYGEMGAAVATDFYDSLREESGVKKPYTALMGDPIPAEQVQASTRAVIKPLFGVSDPNQALSNLNTDVVDRLVKKAGRDTVELNVLRDPAKARYARVPTGAKTCAFCLVLSSRGAVYLNQKAASSGYHGDCDCVPTPMWEGDAYPDGYNPEELEDLYSEARLQADKPTLKGPEGILAELRKQQGIS